VTPAGPRRAEAIVVLGARLLPDGSPGNALARRVATGVALYRQGAAPLLLLSGGGGHGRAEADAMAEAALAAGVPGSALLIEACSGNTVENAFLSAALLADRGLGSIVLVSERYHLFRARLLFRRAGLVVVDSVAPPDDWRQDWPLWLREALALPRSLWRARRRRRD
jgi:uncharacterized SAM-binding protein YcdF (DUF218 family)